MQAEQSKEAGEQNASQAAFKQLEERIFRRGAVGLARHDARR
jgi:hypothetical protein